MSYDQNPNHFNSQMSNNRKQQENEEFLVDILSGKKTAKQKNWNADDIQENGNNKNRSKKYIIN